MGAPREHAEHGRRPGSATPALQGRDAALARLATFAEDAAAGRAAPLVVCGPPGIGASALLHHLAARHRKSALVLDCAGSAATQTMPFGALARLVEPVTSRVATLSGQRPHLLAGAAGTDTDEDLSHVAPSRVARALVQFLSRLAAHRPLLVVVDEAAALDPSSLRVLRLAAAGLVHDPVGFVFATTPPQRAAVAPEGAQSLELGALDVESSAALLHPHLSPEVAHWTMAAARGNPLALGLAPALLGGDPVPDPASLAALAGDLGLLPGGVRAPGPWATLAVLLTNRLSALSPGGRSVAGLVAMEDLRADALPSLAAELSFSATDLVEARDAAVIITTHDGPRPCHESLRRVVLAALTRAERLELHRRLADTVREPSRRAHHLAAATRRNDETAAEALGAAAVAASRRGAHHEAAQAWLQAAERTRSVRRLRARLHAAADAAERGQLPELCAHAETRLAEAAADGVERARHHADHHTHEAARDLPLVDTDEVERHALLAAVAAPTTAITLWATLVEAQLRTGRYSDAARAAARAEDLQRRQRTDASRAGTAAAPGTLQLRVELLTTVAALASGVDGAAAKLVHPWEDGVSDRQLVGLAPTAASVARALVWQGSLRRADILLTRLLALVGDAAPSTRSEALTVRAHARIRAGDWCHARADLAAAVEVCRRAGARGSLADAAAQQRLLDVLRGAVGPGGPGAIGPGDPAVPTDDSEPAGRRVDAAGDTAAHTPRTTRLLHHARALAALLADQPGDAIAPLTEAGRLEVATGLVEPASSSRVGDLAEAAWRTRSREDALVDLLAYHDTAERLGRRSAQAIAARSLALFDEVEFVARFEHALELHADGVDPFERARTELLFAERLWQARRRREARAPLRSALRTFESLGALAWAERACRRLAACGEHREVAPGARALAALPERQLRIALGVVAGTTPTELADELGISRPSVTAELELARRALDVADDAALAALVGRRSR